MGVPDVSGNLVPIENGPGPGSGPVVNYQVCLTESHQCVDRCVAMGEDDGSMMTEGMEEFTKELSTLVERFPGLSSRYLFFPTVTEQAE